MGLILTSVKRIRPMNIGCWLADQISRSDRFRRLFLQRTAWGAFSIYSHVKRSNGKPKIAYPSKSKAENAAVDMAKKYGKPFTVYKCLFCDGWHVSQDAYGLPVQEKSTEAMALEKYAKKPTAQATELDVEKVLSTGIPGLAPVYGGFRGRTLSSTKQQTTLPTSIANYAGKAVFRIFTILCHTRKLSRWPVSFLSSAV